jgi:hypothetical protein
MTGRPVGYGALLLCGAFLFGPPDVLAALNRHAGCRLP